MNNNKTLTHLYSSGRNRLAKVMYMFLYGVVLLLMFAFYVVASGLSFVSFFITLAVIIVIFEFIKRAFYYVALGTVRPTK